MCIRKLGLKFLSKQCIISNLLKTAPEKQHTWFFIFYIAHGVHTGVQLAPGDANDQQSGEASDDKPPDLTPGHPWWEDSAAKPEEQDLDMNGRK